MGRNQSTTLAATMATTKDAIREGKGGGKAVAMKNGADTTTARTPATRAARLSPSLRLMMEKPPSPNNTNKPLASRTADEAPIIDGYSSKYVAWISRRPYIVIEINMTKERANLNWET